MSQQHEVHLYALCWNDRRMLPHFFKHYGCLVDRFCIFDNGSTDGSLRCWPVMSGFRLLNSRQNSTPSLIPNCVS